MSNIDCGLGGHMNRIVVTGMHRSGTTHIGHLVEAATRFKVIHEPGNYSLGDRRVPCWFPSESELTSISKSLPLDLCTPNRIKPRYFKRIKGESAIRSIGRTFLGGTFEASVREAKIESAGILIKCPFLVRLGPMYSHSDIPVIVTVKHPLSNLSSIQHQGWRIRYRDFSSDIFGKEFKKFSRNTITLFSQEQVDFLWLWYFIHRELLDRNFDGHVIWHDAFCNNPYGLLSSELTNRFDLDLPELQTKIKETMFSTIGERGGNLHQMVRDSKKISSLWLKHFDVTQIEYIEKYFCEILSIFQKRSVV